jgi:hypothetical protein
VTAFRILVIRASGFVRCGGLLGKLENGFGLGVERNASAQITAKSTAIFCCGTGSMLTALVKLPIFEAEYRLFVIWHKPNLWYSDEVSGFVSGHLSLEAVEFERC